MLLIIITVSTVSLLSGEVSFSFTQLMHALNDPSADLYSQIFWQLRLPKLVTAVLAGGGLAIAGLMMQTFFQNPLAGPFVLGVNSGGSLGIALWLMGSSFLGPWIEPILPFGAILFSIIGSLSILFLLILLSFKFSSKVVLLIVGLMFGHLADGVINIFLSVGEIQKIKVFLVWGLGSFARIDLLDLPLYSVLMLLGIALAMMMAKRLNLMLLGERYAQSLGLNLKSTRLYFILITGVLSGVITAYCGPIAFLGIMGPHLARAVIRTSDHRLLLPATFLMGAIIAVLADYLCHHLFAQVLPLNSMMGIIGAPIIIYYLWSKRHGELL